MLFNKKWLVGAILLLSFGTANAYDSSYSGAQVDANLGIADAAGAVTGIIKSDGADNLSAGVSGTDFYAPGDDAQLDDIVALTDPNADRIVFWDDSDGDLVYLTLGTGLSITGTTISATGLAGDLKSDGTVALSADWDAGPHEIRAETLESDVTTGTAPLTIASTTLVDNLNADMIDGTELSALATDAELAAFVGASTIVTVGTIGTGVWNGTAIVGDYIDINGMGTAETSIAADDLVIIYDASATAVRKMTRGNFVTGIGAGQAVTLDIGDDGGNDSVDVGEIATVGDTNSIVTEPSADKMLIDMGNNWPTADTANAGDSATAFFSAGTIEHEYGGVEANISAYSGLIGVSGGATSEVDTEAELEGIIGDMANIIQATEIDTLAELETIMSSINIIASTEIDAYSELNTLVADATVYASGQTDVAVADGGTGGSNAATAKSNLGFMTDLTDDATPGLAGNLAQNAYEIQSTTNLVNQLGDNAGTYVWEIEDSDGVTVFQINSDGKTLAAAVNNPYMTLNENDGIDYTIGTYDTTDDRLEFRTSETPNTSVRMYLDANLLHNDGHMNITTGHTYQINGTQIDIGDLGAGGSWTPTATINLDSATLTLNSDALTIDNGSNYTTISNNAAHDTIDEMFAATDAWAAGVSAGTLATLSDVVGVDYTAATILIGDGSNSMDQKAVSGDATLAGDGTLSLAIDVIAAAEMADADHGDVAWSSGVATVQAVSGANAVDSDAYVDGSIDLIHLSTDSVDYTKTTGSVKALTPVTDSTADFAANFTGANLYGGTFIANADDGDLQLPAVAAGMNFTIIALGAIEIVVEPNASDSMLLDGVQLDDADSATSTSAAGDIIFFQYYSAAGWVATSNSWTDED